MDWNTGNIIGSRIFSQGRCNDQGLTTRVMPDGKSIAMWGFAQDSAFGAGDGTVTVPGPALTVPANDNTLIIHLDNRLPDPTSIIIPGLPMPLSAPGQPFMIPQRNLDGRVRSFVHETASYNAAAVYYIWTAVKPGTYLYHSGTHPAVQVQMGLYGSLTKNALDAAPGAMAEAYTGIPYESEVVLLLSEIDPALHNAVATNNYGPGTVMTSTIHYDPKYFLINGEPFSSSRSPIAAGSPGQSVLVRFLNAGLEDHIPVIENLYMKVLAEDGNLLPYPQDKYSLVLSAGRTLDALVTLPLAGGYYPVYDRKLALADGTASPGGMLVYLGVGTNPVTLTVNKTGLGKVEAISLPAGIDCGLDCAEDYNTGTELTLKATPQGNHLFSGWTGDATGNNAVLTLTMDAAKMVTANFSPVQPLTVTSPNGGENLTVRTMETITWNYSGYPGPYVRIQLLKAGRLYTTISYRAYIGANGSGSYNWRLPPRLRPGADYQIKITSLYKDAYSDNSDAYFTISR